MHFTEGASKLEQMQTTLSVILVAAHQIWQCVSIAVGFFVTGHLSGHMDAHQSHQQLYSYKLQRLVKCSKSTCNVTGIRELLICQHCLNRAFDKFYNMYKATWSGAGLKVVCNSVCCSEHFMWHRMNCPNADIDGSAYLISKDGSTLKRTQLSEFLF